jgi:hypothetical protein
MLALLDGAVEVPPLQVPYRRYRYGVRYRTVLYGTVWYLNGTVPVQYSTVLGTVQYRTVRYVRTVPYPNTCTAFSFFKASFQISQVNLKIQADAAETERASFLGGELSKRFNVSCHAAISAQGGGAIYGGCTSFPQRRYKKPAAIGRGSVPAATEPRGRAGKDSAAR